MSVADVLCGLMLRFSTLQRVEIAEIESDRDAVMRALGFSTLQRVEIAEIPVAQ